MGQQPAGGFFERALLPQALQLGMQGAADFPLVRGFGALPVQGAFVDQAKFHGGPGCLCKRGDGACCHYGQSTRAENVCGWRVKLLLWAVWSIL
ncbi:hypothetical protein CBP35_11555 [Acidovorax carolinensis]|nr:hypothetical protein CBP35_11555 [Acidovorax carolinensis]